MDHAITTLQIALDAAKNNEPIHRAEGNIEQADACRAHAEGLIEGLSALQCIQSGYFTEPETFEGKIARAINCHSLESGSDTPDFILAEYLKRCLENFDLTMQARKTWYGPEKPAVDVVSPSEPGYRMLEAGDVIQEGDELLAPSGEKWLTFSPVAFGEMCAVFPARRPVKSKS